MVQVNGLHGFGLVLVQQPQACRVGDRQGEDDSARLGVSPGHDRFHDLILLGTAGHNEDHFLLVDEVHAQETGGTLHAGAFGVEHSAAAGTLGTGGIHDGAGIALIGNNGTGKTTMLKIINGLIDADSGRFTLGSKVQIGYYDQEHHVLHMEKTIFEEISDAYPTLTETEIRNMLAAFLFTGDDVFKLISALSGGERGRVSLAKLMLSEANFLILDEPTNHLDIASKEILEEALNSYTGTVFYVSHDRYFINQTATRILDLTNQAIVNYIGDYDYYLEKKEELTEKYAPAAAQAVTEAKQASDNKLSWQQQKEEQARQRKRENELKKVEARIEELETRDKEIDETMILPDICTNVAECAKLSKEKAAITEELEGLYEKWEELA